MVDPPPLMACLTQAGPFRTSSRLEIRRDGYFMDELRNLARSARGTEAPFAHPSTVRIAEYTVQIATTAMARARHSWAQEEPASILQPMTAQSHQPPAQRNAWTRQSPAHASSSGSPLSGSSQRRGANSGNQPSPLSSSSTDASASTLTTTFPNAPLAAAQQNSASQGTTPPATLTRGPTGLGYTKTIWTRRRRRTNPRTWTRPTLKRKTETGPRHRPPRNPTHTHRQPQRPSSKPPLKKPAELQRKKASKPLPQSQRNTNEKTRRSAMISSSGKPNFGENS
jgi:hypothetical protein